jgi:ADP-dependent phosphofructokinase/glucokinase
VTDRIVLGLGGTVDYLIRWDSAVIEELVLAYGIRSDELSTEVPVTSERNLLRCLLAFVRAGVGGERFVASSDIVKSFARRFVTEVVLGGTGVRAAIAMDKLGVKTTLHLVSIDEHVRRLLPASCSYVCSAVRDTTDPHLIIQFDAGVRVRAGDLDLAAPSANRVILANDPPHEQMRLSSELGAVLADARIFGISSLNAIRDPAVLDQRLAELRDLVAGLPPGCLVHYEDAGFHVPALSRRVNAGLGDRVSVHSMNEDELHAYLGRTCDLLDPVAMAEALRVIRSSLAAPTIVVHTRYWALALGQDAGAFSSALRGGITMASTRYLYGDGFVESDYAAVARLPPSEAALAFATGIHAELPGQVRCEAAILLQTDHPTTVGLGDSFVGGFLAAWPT